MKSKDSGIFVKIAFSNQVDILLKRGSSERPAARFNRLGQDALYLSVDEKSARVAMRKYAGVSDLPRVLIRYKIEPCDLLDLRHIDADELRQRSSLNWQDAIKSGCEPESWKVADFARKSKHIGLIDPSRTNPEFWHVTLFRWNEPGAPEITMVGTPTEISI